MLINITGCDGAGKTTIINFLLQYLTDKFDMETKHIIKWAVFDYEKFPECSFLKCEEDELKDCISIMEEESRFLFLIYLISTSLIKEMKQADEKIILLDGYWHKHYISEKIFGIDANWLKNTCEFMPKADLTILLDVDPELSYKRKTKITRYECGLRDVTKENFMSFQKKFRSEFLTLANDENWVIVDGNQDIENSKNDIVNIIDKFINIDK